MEFTGAVQTERSYTPLDLRSFPLETYAGRIECEDERATKTCTWRGVPADTILSDLGVTASEYAIVHANDDDYLCSFPLGRFRDCILAVEHDGKPLMIDKGGPIRLIPALDDRHCWESVKWVTEIELTETEHAGDAAKYPPFSRTG